METAYLPGPHALAVLAVTIAAFYLYTRSWIRIELVSLLLLTALLVLFNLFPYGRSGARITEVEIFEAFGHPALVAICCLMVLARGLTITGAIEPLVRLLGRLWGVSPWLGLLLTLVFAAGISAFINDTPVVVLMLPMLLGLARRTGQAASKTLMPVNFAVLCGGMLTTIGTSTNILVLNIAHDLGMPPIGIFDFTGTAITALAFALPYLWLIAPRLLPATGTGSGEASRQYEARARVETGNSRLAGRKVADLERALGRTGRITCILREGRELAPDESGPLLAGDAILLRDTPEGLREFATVFRVDLFNRAGAGRFAVAEAPKVDMHLAEIVVGNGSRLRGRTLRGVRFAERHQVVVIGLSRGTDGLLHRVQSLGETPLSAGDVLLVQGPLDRIERLRNEQDLLVVDTSLAMPRSPLAPAALGIMIAVIAAAATRLLPIHIAAFMGVVAMLLTGCVRFEGVGRALALEVVLLVASSIALGQSLVSTGAATWVAQGVAAIVQYVPPAAQVAVFMAFAAVLTNFVSNAAAAAVGTPIACATAVQLGLPLEPFVLAILFGSNLSFATPMAYQTNILIMNAAGYRFADFVRVGGPLVILMLTTLSILLVRRYGM